MSTSEIDREQIVKESDEANDLVWNQRNSPTHDYDPIKLMSDSLEKSKKINYELGIARCFLNSGMGGKNEPFNLYTIDSSKGEMLFLYSDGYADQFGEPKGKKFKSKALTDLLRENSLESMDQQKHMLERTFDAWRGDLEQVDDVCVMGLRI